MTLELSAPIRRMPETQILTLVRVLQHSVYNTSEEEMKEKSSTYLHKMHVFASTHLSMSAATYRSRRVCMLWCNTKEEKEREIECEIMKTISLN